MTNDTRRLLADLIGEESVRDSESVQRCLDRVEAELADLAADVVRPSFDGMGCLVMRFGSGPSHRRIGFVGHVDVVGAEGGWETPPFQLTELDGRLIGRGVCDMKGGVAACVGAIRALADVSLLDGCAIEFCLTGDEESGSDRGTIPLLRDEYLTATAVVCGEPTRLSVLIGSRGLLWIEVGIHGRGGHAAITHLLSNPIVAAAKLIERLEGRSLGHSDDRFDPPTSSLAITHIRAGSPSSVNVIPETAHIALDRRLLPGEDAGSVIREIETAIQDVITQEFNVDVNILKRWPPFIVDPTEPVVVAAQKAVRAIGKSDDLGTDFASNDTSWFHEKGIPSVLLGPGDPEEAHATGESLLVDELSAAISIYANLFASFSATDEANDRGRNSG